jgi:hypothetical protein
MHEALKQTLAALAKVTNADRNAILRQLSKEERRELSRLMAPTSEPAPASTRKQVSPPACSPWLAKRLAQILQENSEAAVTPATRAALRELLGESAR